ncbi:MAG: 3-deoxy-manno-octulosonate cytidylyltransferase [Bacteroidales bacterium]|nr:3-deoxy-manno-octulosonate cytidylyltransferase [Bacteroidales bacterium]
MYTTRSTIIIPARYASTRFPGKPLVDIAGKSMIQRVHEQAKLSAANRVVVATDSQKIFNHVVEFGGYAMMTSEHHKSGTERCGEVVIKLLEKKKIRLDDVVINVQGDEPFLNPEQINSLLPYFTKRGNRIVTLVKAVKYDDVANNPNVVKVVIDKRQCALYFSRAPIPFYRNAEERESALCWKHIGIYAYRVKTLLQLIDLEPLALEQAEMLEQLRWMEHGFRIRTCPTEEESISIDTPEDLDSVMNLDLSSLVSTE